ncbi:hypothetical protein C7974DRAFT_401727 [Boeremia exigua]|uniref:uncharacterized protein n=1 Tax=Boeremia exigua TaxID=749465 RepID=UPI001E8CBBC1|nr:uncharacterized protein C7974DRAFT_401727 [Boeremia exigua]KAH6616394.1 hypothetical protein C7974DRAFT_401727 [Boeremia exigua]
MFTTKAISLRALSRASCQVRCPAARRLYATDYEQRTKETLKTSSRLSWLTTTAALGAAALYYTTTTTESSTSSPSSTTANSSSKPSSPPASSSSSDSSKAARPGHRHESDYATDVPKPVEDRHGDTVNKHSIAARKNQNKVREGKFSGKEFDNHVLEHSPGKPGGDFEQR